MPRIGYVIWFVHSLDRSVAFYRDVIGLEVRLEGDGYVEFAMDNVKFALFERAKLPELIGRAGGQPPSGEIAFVVDDVDAVAVRLREAGAEVLTGPTDRPWGQRTLHVADPDGHVVEYAQNIPRS
ncbi:VOC family protein [Phytoactinopolyspora limicola]|uniref:VOC family protein n=1 Tax=Phytoactinopolyspora limicola TaxID=2715536 RepID=UPI00140D1359|nr:VOC family protein [Phytoactinopolyspora limicola]